MLLVYECLQLVYSNILILDPPVQMEINILAIQVTIKLTHLNKHPKVRTTNTLNAVTYLLGAEELVVPTSSLCYKPVEYLYLTHA
jgi:hypothetical protein